MEDCLGTTISSGTVLNANWPEAWTECYRLKVMLPLCVVIREQWGIIIKRHPRGKTAFLCHVCLWGDFISKTVFYVHVNSP